MKRIFVSASRVALGALLAGALANAPMAVAQNAQFVPMLSFRIGPYAAGGSGFFGGYIDYLDMVNRRDGGVNGVKLVWEECETQYKNELGVACYERLKDKGPTGATVVAPMSTGITYSLLDRAAADKIPLVTLGYGRADAADGRVFPYVFPIVTSYWSQNTAKIKFIGLMSGGMNRLKEKKIVNLYHGSIYGRETIEILDLQAKKYGFELHHIEVPHPGTDQRAQWNKIRQLEPDWVILRGWGEMNPVALKTASDVGFPASRILGVWWSGSEEDVRPAGDAAKGYITATFNLSGTEFPVIQDILQHVYADGGKGAIDNPQRIGQQYYNRGVIQGIVTVEAIRTAQGRFGKRPLTGEHVRWGFENLAISDNRISRLGAFGLMQPLKLSCHDHEGGGAVRFQKWNGTEWISITGWIPSDQSIVRAMVEKSAAQYAEEKGIVVRDCAGEATVGVQAKAVR